MPRWHRAYLVACAFVTAYALGYAAADYLRLPRLTYHQHARLLRWEAPGGASIPSGYLGLWLWALAAGLAAAALAWAAGRLRRAPLSPRALALGAAWSLTAAALAGAYRAWHNWP